MKKILLLLGFIPLGVATYFAMFNINMMAVGTVISIIPVAVIWFISSKDEPTENSN
jgi:hypothetical protein